MLLAALLLCVGQVLVVACLVDQRLTHLGRLATAHDEFGFAARDEGPIYRAIADDGYLWVRYAKHLAHSDDWRVRWAAFDNAPFGRQVHWNSAFAWWLLALGRIESACTGQDLDRSIEHMGMWANPILLAITVLVLGMTAARRFGVATAALLACGMVSCPLFNEGFGPAYPDHHGLINLCALLTFVGLAWAGLGWIGKGPAVFLSTTPTQVRHGAIISAIAAGAGIWISAVSQSLILLSIALGVMVSIWLLSGQVRDAGLHYQRGFWRTWGRVGAITALGFWLLEYFPGWMAMRLEVNHPLYALAFWSGGEILELACLGFDPEPTKASPFRWGAALAWSVGLAALPLAVLIGGVGWYMPMDHFLLEIHRHIIEFQSIIEYVKNDGSAWSSLGRHYLLLLPLALVIAALPSCGKGARMLLCALLLSAVFLLLLACYQNRWNLLAGVDYVMLLAFLPAALRSALPARRWTALLYHSTVLALAALPLLVDAGAELAYRWNLSNRNIHQPEAVHLLHREIAHVIRHNAGQTPVTVFSGPNTSLLLGCFGQFNSIDTLYWEDLPGLRAAAEICGQSSDTDALKALLQRHVTHVVYLGWEQGIIAQFVQLAHPGWGPDQQQEAFASQLFFKHAPPTWLRPLALPASGLRTGAKIDAMVFEVVPGQTEAEAALHTGWWHLAENRPAEAVAEFEHSLRLNPSLTEAQFALVVLRPSARSDAETLMKLLDGVTAERRSDLAIRAATQLASTGRASLAITLLRAMLLRQPDDPMLMLNLASLVASDPSMAGEALDLVKRLRAHAPLMDSPKVQLLYAMALYMNGNRAAYKELQRARELSIANADAIAPSVLDMLEKAMVPSALPQ